MDAETCPFSAASAADSGAVGGHLPHDLLHDPDESAGGAVLFFVALTSWVMKLADGDEVLKMLITAFVVFVLPYIAIAAIAKISFFADELRDFLQS